MEKIKSSLAAKITAMALFVISLLLLIASAGGMVFVDAAGGYRINKEEMLQKGYEEMCRRYSVVAMAAYLGQADAQLLEQTNFRYVIAKKGDLGDDNKMQSAQSFLEGNVNRLPNEESLCFEEYEVSEDTCFFIGEGSIFDTYALSHTPEYTELEYWIDGWYYDRNTETFYAKAEDKLFPVKDGVIYTVSDKEMRLSEAYEDIRDNGEGSAWTSASFVSFYDGAKLVNMSEIQIVDGSLGDLEAIGKVQKNAPDYFAGNAMYKRQKNNIEKYVVASYVNLPLTGEQSFIGADLFVQIKLLVDLAYQIRYAGIVVLILSLIVLIASFCFLMAAAGHRKGQRDIKPHFIDRVPLDLYLGVVLAAQTMIVFLVVLCMQAVDSWSREALPGLVSSGIAALCGGTLAVCLGLVWCMSLAVHCKLGKWWRHTLLYMIARKCMRLLFGVLRRCVYVVKSMLRSMTLLWKAWLVLGLLAFMEFAVLQMGYRLYTGDLIMFWLVEKAVVYPVIILALLQMRRLQNGAKRIANGQMDYQIDTGHMFWELKKHGEYLNDIGYGINCAVNERMKSEHFKTELITNVSHDIKTPLTSIINYVDLLQKEQIENQTVQEYLEVLHRQSARLKKLIEDLMEASKASTGSLSVVMEKCEAGVMLVQTIGEFEEKLMAEQIELQIKKPDTELFIEADNRHLWRVFDNLMNNICKYAQPSTRAYINLEQSGQQVAITFRNISRYQLNITSEELMERFVRGDSSRNTEGSGLGISIAKSLTELMNGTFTLIVDGDLFKVVLTFPLYGTGMLPKEKFHKQLEVRQQDTRMLDSIAAGLQSAGAYAAGFGQGVADKTGRMFWRVGRFAHHVKNAAEQVKEEEAMRNRRVQDAEALQNGVAQVVEAEEGAESIGNYKEQ